MLDLILTRHGMTTAPDVMLGGQLDVPLSDQGRQEARRLAERMRGIRVDRLISSPMQRALETAQTIAEGRPIEVDERLRELDYGRWEGLTHAEIQARDFDLWAAWEKDPAATHSPQGECGDDVAARAAELLRSLLDRELGPTAQRPAHWRSPDAGGMSARLTTESESEEAGERRVMLVGHGAWNRIALCVALGVPVRDYRRRFIQERCNLTVLRYEAGDTPAGAQLVLSNDVTHLRHSGEAPWG